MSLLQAIPKNLPDEAMLKLSRIAELLNVHPQTVLRWVDEDKLPEPLRPSPRVRLFNVGELRNFLSIAEVTNQPLGA